MIIKKAESLEEIGKAFILRYKVFVLEQKFSEEIEIDALDNIATHFIAEIDEKVIGTLRLFNNDLGFSLGRMAVDIEYRKQGIGRKLILKAIKYAERNKADYIEAHAQTQALDFYLKCGFEKVGDVFMEDGAPHVLVKFKL